MWREGFSLFFTLLAWAEGVSTKNKTYVSPGLREQGPPAYCFGIWGRTGRIWPREGYCGVDTDRWRAEEGGWVGLILSTKVELILFLLTDLWLLYIMMLTVKRKGTKIKLVLFNHHPLIHMGV